MAQLTTGSIAQILGKSIDQNWQDYRIDQLLVDSRNYIGNPHTLFFAIAGLNHDGHRYIKDLYRRGVRCFVVEKSVVGSFPGALFLKVDRSLRALQQVATAVREHAPARIIGITGSNGKTVVKEWLAQLLAEKFALCRNPKSYNSQIGVPLSLWRLENTHEIGVFEAGISKPGEMTYLEQMLQPEIGIFTNIGTAHSENFESREQKIEEKLMLFRNCRQLVYEKNGSLLAQKIEAYAASHQMELLSWSRNSENTDLAIRNIEQEGERCTIDLVYKGQSLSYTLPFGDEASLQNALHILRLAFEWDLDRDYIQRKLNELQQVQMRLEMKPGQRNTLLINDAYNSDLESLKVALQYQKNQSADRQRILVISDMLQTGMEGPQLYSNIQRILEHYAPLQIITVGRDWQRYGNVQGARHYPNTAALLRDLPRWTMEGASVLLKGARPFAFEKVSEQLELKSHEAILQIHLDRMVSNLNYFRALLRPATKIMAMVKAFSYGSGSNEIANLLEFHGVNYLGVAYADEGIELRRGGCNLPIMVLNPEKNSYAEMVRYRLEPEIYRLDMLEDFARAVAQEGESSPFPIHLKIETGMQRLGLEEEDLETLVKKLRAQPQLKLASAFSHLAAADDPGEEDFTQSQLDRYQKAADFLQGQLGYSFLKHMANSAGIVNYPEAQLDMVRLGISLYGISGNPEVRNNLRVVSDFHARVSQVKAINKGDTVGYGRSFKAEREMTLATVSVGYADGFRRSLSNGHGEVVIRGKRCPTLGKVCMDMTMVDVTEMEVAVGDEVEIWGEEISVYELAQKMDTIPYEVLTGVSQRVKRIYISE